MQRELTKHENWLLEGHHDFVDTNFNIYIKNDEEYFNFKTKITKEEFITAFINRHEDYEFEGLIINNLYQHKSGSIYKLSRINHHDLIQENGDWKVSVYYKTEDGMLGFYRSIDDFKKNFKLIPKK